MGTHPLDQKLATYPPDSDPNSSRSIGERQKQELDASLTALQTLEPGDPGIEEALVRASVALQTVTTSLGPIHHWTLAWQHQIFRHAMRLLGAQQTLVPRPSLTER